MISVATVCLGVALAASQPVALVKRVKATYAKAGDIQAEFEQVYTEKLRGKKRSEVGRLWAKADGRIRWEYDLPEKKYFVFDGHSAFFYEPANAQVTEFERFQDSQLSTALQFLLGRGDLGKTFVVEGCDERCGKLEAGEAGLLLTPREPLPTVAQVHLIVSEKTARVLRSRVVDPLGNRTEYVFKNVTFRAKISDRKFDFEVPEGVNRLRHDTSK